MKYSFLFLTILLFTYSQVVAQNQRPPQQPGTFKFSDIRWRDMCVLPDSASHTYYIVGPGGRGVRAYTDFKNCKGVYWQLI
jgi:hypothetical protein